MGTVCIDGIGLFQLCPQVSGIQITGQVAGAIRNPGIFIYLAAQKTGAVGTLFPQDFGLGHGFGVIDDQRAPLPH